MSPETKKIKKLREIRFKLEQGLEPDDEEFLDQFLQLLRAKGYDPDQYVFSGFNGKPIVDGNPLPRHDGIYAMNEAGWRQAIKDGESNPGHYAERWEELGVPCIGLFDRSQLADAYSHNPLEHPENVTASEKEWGKLFLDSVPVRVVAVEEGFEPEIRVETYEELLEQRTDFKNVVLGDPLADVSPKKPIVEGVVHKDYPNGSPIDALVAIVFTEKLEPKRTHHRGL